MTASYTRKEIWIADHDLDPANPAMAPHFIFEVRWVLGVTGSSRGPGIHAASHILLGSSRANLDAVAGTSHPGPAQPPIVFGR
jgi:hypothetical protein